MEGAETEVGDAAVPDGGLVLVFELNDEFGDLLDGEAVVVVGGGDFVAADEVATDFDVDVTAGREVGGLGCWLVLLVGYRILFAVRSLAVDLRHLYQQATVSRFCYMVHCPDSAAILPTINCGLPADNPTPA